MGFQREDDKMGTLYKRLIHKPLIHKPLMTKPTAHTLAFLMMVLPPVPLYLAAQAGHAGWIWAWLAVVVLGNLLVVAVR